jgi:hypothetical protein
MSFMIKTSFPPREFVGIVEPGQTGPTRWQIIDDMSLEGLRAGLLAKRSDLPGIMRRQT